MREHPCESPRVSLSPLHGSSAISRDIEKFCDVIAGPEKLFGAPAALLRQQETSESHPFFKYICVFWVCVRLLYVSSDLHSLSFLSVNMKTASAPCRWRVGDELATDSVRACLCVCRRYRASVQSLLHKWSWTFTRVAARDGAQSLIYGGTCFVDQFDAQTWTTRGRYNFIRLNLQQQQQLPVDLESLRV